MADLFERIFEVDTFANRLMNSLDYLYRTNGAWIVLYGLVLFVAWDNLSVKSAAVFFILGILLFVPSLYNLANKFNEFRDVKQKTIQAVGDIRNRAAEAVDGALNVICEFEVYCHQNKTVIDHMAPSDVIKTRDALAAISRELTNPSIKCLTY